MISYRKLAMRVLGHSPVSAAKTTHRRATAKRAAALALTAALVVGMTLPAFADVYDLTKGDISVGFKNNQQTVTQRDGDGYVSDDKGPINNRPDENIVITGTTTENTVTINSNEGETVNVTLENVTINVDEGYDHVYDPNAYKTAVSVTGSGDTNIELNGNNTLTSGYGHAGLEHNKTDDSGTLTITDDKGAAGSLTANGGFGGAGIGGSTGHDGQVTITGGTINATGNNGGAGIGGAGNQHDNEYYYTGDGDVTITGGTITATGGEMAAGIGGGAFGDGNVTITGGDITAKGDDKGAGIGGGMGAKPKGTVSSSSKGDHKTVSGDTLVGGKGTVTISGGTITEATGGELAAGIGGGSQGDSDVTITGNAIIKDAQGGDGAAGIGNGSSNEGVGSIEISGDSVIGHAEGGEQAAGIGGSGWMSSGTVTIKDNAKIDESVGGNGGAGIGSGVYGDVTVIIEGNSTIGTTTGGTDGAGIGGGYGSLGDVTIEGNVTIKNAQGGAAAAGIGGGSDAKTKSDGTGNRIIIRSNEDGSPTINATGGVPEVDDDGNVISAGGAAIGSGASLPDENGNIAPEANADITIKGKVTIDAKAGEGNAAIGANNTEQTFNGLQVGTTITRRNAKGDDVSQPGDVVREQAPTETEAAEAPSTGSVEVERPVTVEGLYVTNVLGKQITHTCTQNGTTLTIRANGIVTSAHLTLGMVRTLKAQGVKTLVFTTLLSRSTTVSVDALLAAEPDAPDETAVVWTHTGLRAALTIGGADHSALLK